MKRPKKTDLMEPPAHRRARDASITKRIKTWCRSSTNIAIRYGVLVPEPCSVCGTTAKIEAHHIDYNEPLKVEWLCKAHHADVHRQGFEPVQPRTQDRPYKLTMADLVDRYT